MVLGWMDGLTYIARLTIHPARTGGAAAGVGAIWTGVSG